MHAKSLQNKCIVKRTEFAILFLLLSVHLWAQTAADTIETSLLADQIIETAKQYIGTPYHYGSNGPKTFDCSGFTSFIFKKFGYTLPRSSDGQGAYGRPVDDGFENLQKGDLVLFSRRGRSVGHVGIFIERDTVRNSFKFIHAATHGGVMISNYYEQYYKATYRFARRVLPDFDTYDLGDGQYPFDSVAYLHPDQLKLDSADMRIVLFANGRWAYVSESGVVTIPSDSARIMLSPDGRWGKARKSVALVANKQTFAEKQVITTEKSDTTLAPTENKQESVPTLPEMIYHTVRKGDTLYSIARRYGTTVGAICRLNGIKENTVLQINRRLQVK